MSKIRRPGLSLFWKLLLPFLLLLAVVGSGGTFLLVRDESNRADQALDEQLTQRSLDVRTALHDREVNLQETANLAANLQGMATAVQAHNTAAAAQLLKSVLVLKPDVTLLVVTDRRGTAIAEYSRTVSGARPTLDPLSTFASTSIPRTVMRPGRQLSAAALLAGGDGSPKLAIGTTICAGSSGCTPVGAALAGLDLSPTLQAASTGQDVSLIDTAGNVLAGNFTPSANAPSATGFSRRFSGAGHSRRATLTSPYVVQGDRIGTLAVTLSAARAYASVRSTAWRIALVVLATMLGIVLIGASLSHYLLHQVRRLLATHKALATGDLSARVRLSGRDELTQLAEGVNDMADALQSSYAHLEQRVEERTAEVQRLLKDRTDFFTALSHEFRTPLAVIRAQAQLVREESFNVSHDSRARTSTIINDSAQQLLEFVNNIVDIARLESGAHHLALEPIELAPLLRQLTPALEVLGQPVEVQVTSKIPRRLPKVHAEANVIREIVFNLVDNAVKYTPAGGHVTITAGTLDNTVQITVRDTGLGIPRQAQERLFEPFYRVEANQTQAGQPSSGLGLALTSKLVGALGGSIAVVSEVGTGSTFTVSLPVVGAEPPPDSPSGEQCQGLDGPGEPAAHQQLSTSRRSH